MCKDLHISLVREYVSQKNTEKKKTARCDYLQRVLE